MAITNAQQFKQLVNPPMEGKKRPGYRGDDAYGGGTTAGGDRSNSPGDRGDGPATENQGVYGDSGGSNYGQFNRRAVQNQKLKGAGFLGKDLGMNIGEQNRLAKFGDFIKGGGIIGNLLSSLFSGSTGTIKVPPPGGEGGGNIPYWAQLGFSSEQEYLNSLQAQAPSSMDQETEDPQGLGGLRLAFRAEGGPIGGEYDFESARQMYGLGKLVKKVGRTVKKIAKSPIGKAAILYAGGTYLGGLKTFGGTGFGSGNFLTNLKSGQGISNLGKFASSKLFGNVAYDDVTGTKTGGLFSKIPGGGVTAGIVGASALAGLLTPEQEEEAQTLAKEEGIDIEAARNSILNAGTSQDFRARAFVAEGGKPEPVAKSF